MTFHMRELNTSSLVIPSHFKPPSILPPCTNVHKQNSENTQDDFLK